MDKQLYHINCPHCGYRIGDGYTQRLPDGTWHVTVTMSSISKTARSGDGERDTAEHGSGEHGKT